MRVAVASDGGAHAGAFAAHLERAGHEVALVESGGPALVRAARRADVVYDAGRFARATLASGVLHRPLVVRVPGDPALARGRRLGLEHREDVPPRTAASAPAFVRRAARAAVLRRATRIVCPSAWLAGRARDWGLAEERLAVVPNAAPAIPELPAREELRASFGFAGPVVVHAGRLTAARRLDRLVETLARAPRIGLVLAGTGPDEARLRELAETLGVAPRLQLHGQVTQGRLLELFAAADLALQPAVPGVFPNAALEALALGRPVLTTLAAGSPELVRDGENGLVVDPPDPDALAAAIERYVDDDALRERLERNASVSVLAYAPERVHAQLEAVLAEAAAEAA